jgi:hypothetical protein
VGHKNPTNDEADYDLVSSVCGRCCSAPNGTFATFPTGNISRQMVRHYNEQCECNDFH